VRVWGFSLLYCSLFRVFSRGSGFLKGRREGGEGGLLECW
jgi:hypothetical protein